MTHFPNFLIFFAYLTNIWPSKYQRGYQISFARIRQRSRAISLLSFHRVSRVSCLEDQPRIIRGEGNFGVLARAPVVLVHKGSRLYNFFSTPPAYSAFGRL